MKSVFLTILLFSFFSVTAQKKYTTKDYISKWSATAVVQMHKHKIPASITLAQGILESGNGNSKLAKIANNHFGIKCHSTWTGDTFIQDDDAKDECFRAYNNAAESFKDHSLFLKKRRYSKLFDLKLKDYKKWAKGLKSAGYATNPKYPSLLISIIEKHELWRFDSMDLDEIENHETTTKPEVTKPIITEHTSELPVNTIEYNLESNTHSLKTSKNKVKYIIVKKGDTFYKLSKELELTLRQMYKYNEFKNKDVLIEGDIVYVSPKRWRARKNNPVHICETKMSLRDVAHIEGVKLKRILKMNNSENPDKKLPKGTKVTLR